MTAYEKPGQNFNRYLYANNSPYNFTDPDGRDEDWFANVDPMGNPGAGNPLGGAAMASSGAALVVVGAAVAAPAATTAALARPAAVTAIANEIGAAAGVTGTAGAAAAATKEATAVAGKITGYTKHGLNQAISRDGGRGVSPKAILSAVRNPTKVTEQTGGKTMYTNKEAKVVLNDAGKVITTMPKNSEALRDPKVK